MAILPLSRDARLTAMAKDVYDSMRQSLVNVGLVQYDDTQSIGKRYRRQDEIGTPICVTVDFDSLEDNTVTIRDRDTMAQNRISVTELHSEILKRIG